VQHADEGAVGEEARLVEEAALEIDAEGFESRAGIHHQPSMNA
jgi:hypothetical protein